VALVDATVAAYGGIDILVNNVGGGGGGARVSDSTDDDWRGALERNLIQTVRMMRLALPHMKGRPGAAIVNIASISGLVAATGHVRAIRRRQGDADLSIRSAGRSNSCHTVVRVNTVSPGSILVEGNGWDRYRLANPGCYADYVRYGFPMGRLGTAEEVADVIVFAASPRAHWVSGRNIAVDGARATPRTPRSPALLATTRVKGPDP
jgi:3-oxoacyl-[acyl-carrier protein] reductase